jgi:Bacterial SH3 domain
MKATIRDSNVKVYSSMDANGLSIATLQQGNVIEIGSRKRSGGKFWTPIVLSTGQQAFIPAEAKIFVLRQGALMQNNVEVHSEPSSGSLIKQQLSRNTKISILDVVTEQGQQWVRITDAVGNEGFISGDTRVRIKPVRTKASAGKSMMSGGMWLVAGLVMVFSERSAPAGSGLSMLGYFALLFGIVMLISGVIQFFTAPA